MKSKNITTTIFVDQTPVEVFNAINNVRNWWPGEIEGETAKLHAEFSYNLPEKHYSKQRISEFIIGKKIVWKVLESNLGFIQNKSEWQGTDIIFEIASKGDKTKLHFTHRGLSPLAECYQACLKGWTTLINDNLNALIATGDSQKP
ncbi:SRPBCC family protein [Galbibacter sp.]|uniref:SRPBCC family protein n=1 Tax=Galbibacter sp. TaxID=2918471 RepID=UPI003A94EE56